MTKAKPEKVEGLGGDLIFYYLFCAWTALFLLGLIQGTYVTLVSGEGSTRHLIIIIILIVQAGLLLTSLELLLKKKRVAKWLSVAYSGMCFITFLLITLQVLKNADFPNYSFAITNGLVGIIGGILFIVYFLTSERVKNTLTK